MYGSTRRTRARSCRLSRAVAIFSTWGSSRIAASTMSKPSAGGSGSSMRRRWRLASDSASSLSAMRVTRRTWEKAVISAAISVRGSIVPGIQSVRKWNTSWRRITATMATANQRSVNRRMKKIDFMAPRIATGRAAAGVVRQAGAWRRERGFGRAGYHVRNVRSRRNERDRRGNRPFPAHFLPRRERRGHGPTALRHHRRVQCPGGEDRRGERGGGRQGPFHRRRRPGRGPVLLAEQDQPRLRGDADRAPHRRRSDGAKARARRGARDRAGGHGRRQAPERRAADREDHHRRGRPRRLAHPHRPQPPGHVRDLPHGEASQPGAGLLRRAGRHAPAHPGGRREERGDLRAGVHQRRAGAAHELRALPAGVRGTRSSATPSASTSFTGG